ncbi:MAG TPA: DUF4270 family protein [Catalimonadaceae bacterium]|nr:DUF4270 family protein [Catalimonadaceae bacterium]
MKHFQGIIWLALNVSALFFGGCIKNTGDSFEAPPDLAIAKTEYIDSDSFSTAEFPITAETYKFDSLATSNREYVFAGSYDDIILGKLNTESYFQFLPESYTTCPDDILDQYTKATLTLQYDKVYGPSGTDQYGLFPLKQILDGDRTHFGSEAAPAYRDTALLTTLNASRTDNIIRIDANELGNEIIQKWKKLKTFGNDRTFLDSCFKGFAIKSLNANPQVARFDLQYNTDAAPAFLQISYRVKTSASSLGELRTLKFRTNTSTVQYYRFSTDYKEPWKNIVPGSGITSDLSSGNTAIQGLAGLASVVKMPGLLDWKQKQTRKIKVFKAELIVTPKLSADYPLPEFLRISCRNDYHIPNEDDFATVVYNDEGILTLLQSNTSLTRAIAKTQTSAQVFPYSTANDNYRCNVTSHIQDILDGTRTSSTFVLYSAQWGTTVNRLQIPNGNVKLKIYYYPI